MAETAIATVLSRIENLAIDSIVQETTFLHGVADQVELLKADLRRLQSFLKDADTKWRNGDESVKNWVRELRDVAYQAENVVDKANYITRRNKMKRGFKGALSRYAHKPSDLKTIHDVGVKIQQIKTQLRQIFNFTSYGIPSLENIGPSDICFEDETLRNQRLVSPNSDKNVDVIGFDNDRDQIVEKLVDPNNKLLTVISIVGMGGLGKSTLARKVYNSLKVKQHFDVVAWVAVSQKYDISHLLKEIMEKTMGSIKTEEMNEEEIRKALRDFLKEKRYLLVLDDVWRSSTWGEFQDPTTVFLEANIGSRIVFTTRSLEVAKNVNQRTYIHDLKFLDSEKSWDLLRSKAFPAYRDVSESLKNELEGLGKKLAKKCNGLPLALVVLGGYLSKNLEYHKWSELVGNMDWEIVNNERNVRGILALSYHDLPDHHLKSCFLYIASFPEDYEIEVTTLIELWIAEGLVPHRLRHELEETAHGVVDELALRCMIQVAKRSIVDGQIDSIRIHDVLRDWGIDEGRKDGFIKVCNNHSDIETTESNAMPAYRVSLDNFFDNQLGEVIPDLRSLLAFKLKPYLVPEIGGLGFLRVLHLEGLKEITFPKEIKQMIHLRYLGFRDCKNILFPSSIGHLLNLQTLRASGTIIRWLPSSFWDIPTLRHVYLDNVTFLSAPKPRRQRRLQTLQIYGKTYDRSGKASNEATIKSLGGMTPIVSLVLYDNIINDEVFSEFPSLLDLTLFGRLTERGLPNHRLFPHNLRKLYLAKSFLEEDPMPILEKLPSLVVLSLFFDAYSGSIMCCSSDGFPRLKDLRMWFLSVEEWKVEVGAMRRLTHLRLEECSKLRLVPEWRLQQLTSLQELHLDRMDSLSMNSVDKLEKNGCKVVIKKY